MNNYIAIMAGGAGTRFWPASRSSRPKQFLDILGVGKSFLRLTFERAEKIVPRANILIVSNQKYKDLIKEQVPEIGETQILLEPSMNNTAPCILYSALHLNARNVNATFAVLPSDHVILKEDEFVSKMKQALEYAGTKKAIITLGIQPSRPDTGYGYINYEKSGDKIKRVLKFKEKPDKPTAQKYMDTGGYLWNAGIFVWSAKTIIDAFAQHAKDILEVLSQDIAKFGSAEEQNYINKVYPNTRKISVDFAILEKADNVFTIPADIDWSDLGTWDSLYNYLEKDNAGNVLQCTRKVLHEAEGNFIRSSSPRKLIVAKGIKDYIVIDDNDVLLIYPRQDEQEIKQIRNSLNFPDIK